MQVTDVESIIDALVSVHNRDSGTGGPHRRSRLRRELNGRSYIHSFESDLAGARSRERIGGIAPAGELPIQDLTTRRGVKAV